MNKVLQAVTKRKANLTLVVGLLFCFYKPLYAQNFESKPLNLGFNHQFYIETERSLAKLTSSHHTVMKPYRLEELSIEAMPDSLLNLRKHNSWLGKALHRDYRLQKYGEDWAIKAEPILDLSIGRDFADGKNVFFNGRAVQVYGYIGKKIAFYTSLYENQAIFPNYLDSSVLRYGVVPGQGQARLFPAREFGNATAYLSYTPSKWMNLQFGHDRVFWGDGYRSFMLSDQTFPYPFVKLTASFGPFKYQYLFMQHSDLNAAPLNFTTGYRQKYMANGLLSWQINRRLSLAAFQSVVWQADDSISGRRGIDLNYLNPIIFWHPIQYSLGSEGNLLIGLNAKFKLTSAAFLYYQLVLDELSISDLLAQNGWAGNKYAWQIGLRWFDMAQIPGLNMRLEYNQARPYTFGHWSSLTSYTHYNQSLAHPLGANFREAIVMMDYKYKRLLLQGKIIGARMGLDSFNFVSGQDVFTSFLNRPADFGLAIGQGRRADLLITDWKVGYLVNPLTNAQFYLSVFQRNRWIAGGSTQRTFLFSLGYSTNLRNLYYDF
jgi:hypothetical protein